MDEKLYCFGDYRFFPDRQLLLRDGRPVRIGTRALDLLHLLVVRAGEVVSKEQLIGFAWPRTFVHEDNLKVNIAALRRAIPQTSSDQPYIATVPGRGYRFVAPLRVLSESQELLVADPVKARSSDLPGVPTIIGRDDDMANLSAKLVVGGFVTIVGSAGVGKTTVAVGAARDLRSRYRDGVCFIDLAAVDDPLLVCPAIALSLGINSNVTNMLAGIVDALRGKETLLVLDNCEHVLGATSTTVEHLRSTLPHVHVLATSREPLRAKGEAVYRLPALRCPEEGASLDAAGAMAFPAVALFVKRANEAHGYRLGDADAPVVAAICRRLDGIALAIELAAPRLQTSDTATLLHRLEESFEPLDVGAHTGPVRQRTLLATLDWSYRLLSGNEASLLRLLSVFAGTFTLDDVIGVSEHLGIAIEDVVACLGSLSAKSLLSAAHSPGGLGYRLLHSTRSFAAERLRAAGEHGVALSSYARYLQRVFEQAELEWNWRAREDWTAYYGYRANDVRKAIDWAFGEGDDPQLGVRLTVAAIPLWDELSSVGECRLRVERALRSVGALADGAPALKMKLMAAHASGFSFSDDLGAATDAAWTEAWRLASEADNVDYQLRTLWGLAVLQSYNGQHRRALATLTEFGQLTTRESDHSATPDGERLKLMIEFYGGDLKGAHAGLTRLASQYDNVANRSRISRFKLDRFVAIRGSLATVTWVMGDHRRAMAMVQEALEAATALSHLISHSNALALTALPLTLWTGALDVAQQHVATLDQNLAIRDIGVWKPLSRFFKGAIASGRGDANGVDIMHGAIDELIASSLRMRTPVYLAMLAEAALHYRRIDTARRSITTAFARAEQQDEQWSTPELLHVDGLLRWQEGDTTGAEERLLRAASAAEKSGALTFQLRAATSLAELWLTMGRRSAAAAHLAPVYDRFDHDFDTRDTRAARTLLASL